ncbi:MAG: hypothetical protein AMXMBFR84_19750 [Candidatus Hydrogenedentota bacterium]
MQYTQCGRPRADYQDVEIVAYTVQLHVNSSKPLFHIGLGLKSSINETREPEGPIPEKWPDNGNPPAVEPRPILCYR